MNKTEKRMKIFTLIMQVIIQAVLLFPWMNMGHGNAMYRDI